MFKYSDFIISIICNIRNVDIEPLNLLLPIGISFYTFQSISYIVDIYNEKCKPANSIIRYAMYVLMFPQLISGPIVTYKDINKELNNRKESLTNIKVGAKYFILGLGFKVLLANRIGCLWNDINMIGVESISTGLAWLSVIAYSLQIYFDFCGYSFMAVGLGKIMGFTLPINFETPYLSTSMTEFFRRWHISLGNWFKNYVYIPLGGNRNGKLKTIFNLLVVWILTGLWHGANYNFILWGLFIWLVIVLEKLCMKKYLDKYKIFGHLYMLILIPITWSIFAITDINQLGILLTKLFSYSNGLYELDFIKYLSIYGVLILVGIVCTTKIPKKLLITKQNTWVQTIILLLIFSMSIYYLYIGLNNPFLYFSF
ncbi:MAG: MBOAT family O-acyltransferase [Clostridia bacterium]